MSTVAPKVDVLIVTAADGEDEAVRAVEDGAIGVWEDDPGPPGFGFGISVRQFTSANGQPLRMALVKAPYMGTEASGNVASRLVEYYRPRCLAMCGVCAGRPGRTNLGDVIIADRVYRYDAGEVVNPTKGGKPRFKAEMMTYQLRPQWKQRAEKFRVASGATWLVGRPRPRELQGQWLLKQLLDGNSPLVAPDQKAMCADWTNVLDGLRRDKRISKRGARPKLLSAGRKYIERVLYDNGGRLPQQSNWQSHVGPVGTGTNLQRDVDIWERLSDHERHVLGLEMEAAVIGMTAHIQDVPDMIVAKGVLDHADPAKSDSFRAFAARAAAEVLIGLLRQCFFWNSGICQYTAVITTKIRESERPLLDALVEHLRKVAGDTELTIVGLENGT